MGGSERLSIEVILFYLHLLKKTFRFQLCLSLFERFRKGKRRPLDLVLCPTSLIVLRMLTIEVMSPLSRAAMSQRVLCLLPFPFEIEALPP